MGAWATGSFHNDDALDWAGELSDGSRGWDAVGEALAPVAEAPDGTHPGLRDCCVALAAAEVLAARRGKPPRDFPPGLGTWLIRQRMPPGSPIENQARAAVALIRLASELRDLWAQSPDLEAWLKDVADLEARLG